MSNSRVRSKRSHVFDGMKILLNDMSITYPTIELHVQRGHPIYMRDGGSVFDTLVMEGNACKGNFFNMFLRWMNRRDYDDFVGDMSKNTPMGRISEYWSNEIMYCGMGLYQMTGGSAIWEKRTYEDFMDMQSNPNLRFDVRRSISKIKSVSSLKRRITESYSSIHPAMLGYLEGGSGITLYGDNIHDSDNLGIETQEIMANNTSSRRSKNDKNSV